MSSDDTPTTGVFRLGNTGDALYGRLGVLCGWQRELSAQEVAELYRDPYFMFRKQLIITVAGGVDELTASEISSDVSVETSTIGQKHALVASEIASNVSIETSVIGQKHVLVATEIASDISIETSTIGQIHVLIATEISSNASLETPTLHQIYYAAATILFGFSPVGDAKKIAFAQALVEFFLTITAAVAGVAVAAIRTFRNSLGIKDDRIFYPKRKGISK